MKDDPRRFNKNGPDKEALQFFQEASWNNPVIRIVDSNLKDILVAWLEISFSHLMGSYQKLMLLCCQTGKKYSVYLNLLEQGIKSQANLVVHKTVVGMYCFGPRENVWQIKRAIYQCRYMNGSEVVSIQ